MKIIFLPVATFLCLLPWIGRGGAECAEGFQALPSSIEQTKIEIYNLALDNQDNWGDYDIQNQMEALTTILEDWYVDNRPTNEVELEQSAWRILWIDNPFYVVDSACLATDRDNTYQVVRNENFGQIAKYDIGWDWLGFSVTFYTIEESRLTNAATAETCGQKKVNVWELDFPIIPFRFSLGYDLEEEILTEVIDDVISGDLFTLGVPFPLEGGEDWIRFMDEDIRIVSHGGNYALQIRDDGNNHDLHGPSDIRV